MDSFYSQKKLIDIGLLSIGTNVKISRFARFYDKEKITIGDHVRIDDFCILSGKITIQNYVHIAAGCYLYGGDVGIEIYSFANLSSRIAVYAKSDDYSGKFMTNPMVDEEFTNVTQEKVIVNQHVIIGTGSVILPGVIIGEGVAIGSLSLVNKSLPDWKICAGIPAVPKKDRNKDLLKLEEIFLNQL